MQIKPIHLAAAVILLILAMLFMQQQQQPQPRPVVVTPRVNVTAPPPSAQPPAQQLPPPPAVCQGEMYKTRNITVCGVPRIEAVDQYYVYVKSGWVSGGPIYFGSDVSACRFSIGVGALQFDCPGPIAIRR